MPSLAITLTESQMAFVEARAKAGGLASASDYVAFLIQVEQMKEHREKIDALLLEALDSGPATLMTDRDWEEIEQQTASQDWPREPR